MNGEDRRALGARLVERAYLTGDFVLRSGRRSSYYLDKYRFETDPDLLDGLGRLIAHVLPEHAPDAELLAGPELGAVPLAALACVHSRLPFVIVRKEAKLGTANRIEGVFHPASGLRGRRRGHVGGSVVGRRVRPARGRVGRFRLQFA